MRLLRVSFCLLVAFATFGTTTAEAQLPRPSRYQKPKADSLLKKAIAQENSGNLRDAIRLYREIRKLKPKDPRPTNSIAGLYGKLRQPKKQFQWARKAIEQDSSFFQAHINSGNALIAMRKTSRAKERFGKAIQLEPDSPLGYYSLGVLAERQRELERAIKYYEKSVSVDSQFENGYFNLGAMYANAGKFDKAIDALKRALELNPDARDARAMLRKIKRREK
jgi:tetratricopeptide (TPR) repeat protein